MVRKEQKQHTIVSIWGGGYHPLYFFSTPFFPRGFLGNASVYLSANHFHIFWCKNLANTLLPLESVYQKVKCLRGVPPPGAQLLEEIETQFQSFPMFSGSSYPMKSAGELYDQTGGGKSKMTASKPEVPISQPVDMIGTRF